MENTSSNASRAATVATRKFIAFRVDGQEYGFDIMSVREIRIWSATTTLPNAPPFIRGVINLRGMIVPILDLRSRFGLAQTDISRQHVVIILRIGQRTVGVLVDAVSDILSAAADEIRPLPQHDNGAEAALIEGIMTVGDRMVSLVALDHLLGNDMRLDSAEMRGAA